MEIGKGNNIGEFKEVLNITSSVYFDTKSNFFLDKKVFNFKKIFF